MSENDLSFLQEDEPTPAPAAPAEPEPQATPEPQAAPEPEPAPAPELEPAPPPTPEPQPIPPGHVPIGALLSERDKRTAAEARLRQQDQTPPPAIPDPYEDPEGYQRFQTAQTEQIALNVKLDLSEDMARERHGDALVDEARNWALARMDTSPAFRAEVLGHRNPYGYAVAEFQRTQLLEEFKDPAEIAAYRAWKAAQPATPGAPQPPAAAPAAPPSQPAPAAPPRSLASAPSAGGVQTQVVEDPFDAEFPKR